MGMRRPMRQMRQPNLPHRTMRAHDTSMGMRAPQMRRAMRHMGPTSSGMRQMRQIRMRQGQMRRARLARHEADEADEASRRGG